MSLLALAAVLAVVTVTLAPTFVAVITGTLLPMVVALAAHADAPAGVKRWLGGLAALATAVTAQATLADDGSLVITITHAFVLAVVAFIVQQASYTAVWRRLGLNRWRWLLPALGLGEPHSAPAGGTRSTDQEG